jgi:hypothetical protein
MEAASQGPKGTGERGKWSGRCVLVASGVGADSAAADGTAQLVQHLSRGDGFSTGIGAWKQCHGDTNKGEGAPCRNAGGGHAGRTASRCDDSGSSPSFFSSISLIYSPLPFCHFSLISLFPEWKLHSPPSHTTHHRRFSLMCGNKGNCPLSPSLPSPSFRLWL